MTQKSEVPDRLYKYRGFNDDTIEMLTCDRIFYADPSSFNDPLDCKPTVHADIPNDKLEKILEHFIRERLSEQMNVAAKSLKYKGPKIRDHIKKHSDKQAQRILIDTREYAKYYAEESIYGGAPEALHTKELCWKIKEELLMRYERGIFCLTSEATCPLMWSHYGDEHRGVCLGYSVTPYAKDQLYKVDYESGRRIMASDIAAMIDGNEAALHRVDKAALLTKAPAWAYEHEWRLIGKHGLQSSRLKLEEVIFGLRCPHHVKFTIVKALEKREQPAQFLEICSEPDTFKLEKQSVDTDELLAGMAECSIALLEGFEEMAREDSEELSTT